MDDSPPEETVELMAMLKRRGFIKPAYGLYGGVAGFYDYGPLGQGLKRRFEDLWRQHYVVEEGFGEVATPTVAPEAVFEASGHLDQFDDVLVECEACQAGARADHLLEDELARLADELEEDADALLDDSDEDDLEAIREARESVLERLQASLETAAGEPGEATMRRLFGVGDEGEDVEERSSLGPFEVRSFPTAYEVVDSRTDETVLGGQVRCLSCGQGLLGTATVGPFNLMFATRIGPGDGDRGYLRPETAQGLFVNMPWLYRYNREKTPFGAVQIGRAYRNEISPRQGLVRLREFWQAEAEVFVDPEDKDHPRFDEVAGTRVDLVPAGSEALETTLGDAVAKGVIANEQVAWYIARTQRLLEEAGVDGARLRFRQHEADEMAHYATDCWDAEFESARYGWVECVGIADRGCYDLESHQAMSEDTMEAFRRYDEPVEREVTRVEPDMAELGPAFKGKAGDVAEALRSLDPGEVPEDAAVEVVLDGQAHEVPPEAFEVVEETETVHGEGFLPHVIEPSYGVDRILYAVLEHNWDTDGERDRLELPAPLAPVQVGVLPLVSKDGLPDEAREIERELKERGLVTQYDEGGSIGRRYARLDEVGTPLAVTVDHETLEEGSVTVRDRDSHDQVRVPLDANLPDLIARVVEDGAGFELLAEIGEPA